MDNSQYQKVSSSESSIRAVGYLELAEKFTSISDKLSQEYAEWLPLVQSFVREADIDAKYNGLIATLRFTENYIHAGRIAESVCDLIVQDCLQKGPMIKALSQQVLRAFVVARAKNAVRDALTRGLSHKCSEVVVACLESLRQLTREFGLDGVEIGPFWVSLNRLLEDRDPSVRAMARHYTFVVHEEAGVVFDNILSKLMKKEKIEDLRELWECLSIERRSCQG